MPYRQDKVQPVAWKQLGEDVRIVESEVEARIGERPLVVGMDKYNLASELAFYRRQDGEGTQAAVANTASRHLFGGGALMYEIWSRPEEQRGRTMILVSFDPRSLSDESVGRWVEDAGPVVERPVKKLGVPAGRYYYRVVDGYHAP